MSTNEKHWVENGSEEMRQMDPRGTTHPRIVTDHVHGCYVWNPEMTKMYGPYEDYSAAIIALGASPIPPE